MMRNEVNFRKDDDGAGTAWWVFWMAIFLIFGGAATDTANAWRMRAELQATADAAAHAGVIDLPNSTAAAAAANSIASQNMSIDDNGDVLASADIEVGVWNESLRSFVKPTGDGGGSYGGTGGSATTNAIRVTTRRDATNGNVLQTYFLRLIGFDSWNVTAEAVAQRYFPSCMQTDGLIARNVVDLQSNNVFKSGICIHGNNHVSVNNGNTWESGVSVTMPSLADFSVPSSDMDTQNAGLADALGEEWMDPKIVDQTDYLLNQYLDPTSSQQPSYIGYTATGQKIATEDIVINVQASAFNPDSVQAGHIYHVTCPGNSLLNLGGATVMEKVVIISDCRIYTGNNSTYSDVVLGTFSGDMPSDTQYSKSINIGQGNTLGANDNCALSGNVTLIGQGSIVGAADQTFYGVQAIAVWDIQIAARDKGLNGILFQSGHNLDITSNNAFGSTCADIGALQVPYFRLVL